MNALQDVVDYGIIGLLLALSIWTMAIAVERWLFYRRVDLAQYPDSLALAQWLRTLPILAYWAPCLVLC